MQETYLRAWRSYGASRAGRRSAWLLRIATNVCLTALSGDAAGAPLPPRRPQPDHRARVRPAATSRWYAAPVPGRAGFPDGGDPAASSSRGEGLRLALIAEPAVCCRARSGRSDPATCWRPSHHAGILGLSVTAVRVPCGAPPPGSVSCRWRPTTSPATLAARPAVLDRCIAANCSAEREHASACYGRDAEHGGVDASPRRFEAQNLHLPAATGSQRSVDSRLLAHHCERATAAMIGPAPRRRPPCLHVVVRIAGARPAASPHRVPSATSTWLPCSAHPATFPPTSSGWPVPACR